MSFVQEAVPDLYPTQTHRHKQFNVTPLPRVTHIYGGTLSYWYNFIQGEQERNSLLLSAYHNCPRAFHLIHTQPSEVDGGCLILRAKKPENENY